MSTRKLRFDGWLLDPDSGDLERGSTRIRLQEQPVQVLRVLIAHAGSVVSREQLIALLWPKGVVDFDTGLNAVIHKLRSALGDTSDAPHYIETLPRRGYRFIGVLDPDPEVASTASPAVPVGAASARSPRPVLMIGALAVAAFFIGSYVLWRARSGESPTVIFSPPPHSIAVLPFVNLSGNMEQEYFSDGLTEELLNSLAHIDGLQVAARTSSFSFREHPNVADVAHKLNVATVLEGSVRRSGHTVRISAQLINAVTGFHLWSKTYDRDLGDVLKMQTEIATAVASALEVTLLRDANAKIELGGTRNPAAFDAYLRGSQAYQSAHSAKDLEPAIAQYSEAIRLDPNYALAFARRSLARTAHAEETGASIGEEDERALADARRAVTLAPDLGEGHLAFAYSYQVRALDFAQTKVELQRALALAPGSSEILGWYGRFAVFTGRTDAGIAAVRRAVVLDPINPLSQYRLAQSLYYARRYTEAVAASNDLLALDPQEPDGLTFRGLAYYNLGDFEHARASCEAGASHVSSQFCLAITYHRLARQADAEVALGKLSTVGDRWAYRCAAIYAQWGNTPQALEWLETAVRRRTPLLRWLKIDPLLDPLRQEPRFQAIEKALNFPD